MSFPSCDTGHDMSFTTRWGAGEGEERCTWHPVTRCRFCRHLLLRNLIERAKGMWICERVRVCKCNSSDARIQSEQKSALSCFVSKLCKVTSNLGTLYFLEDSKKLICKPDTNKQLMHKYARNFKTKGEQLYLCCKGGVGGFLSLSKQHRARLRVKILPTCA